MSWRRVLRMSPGEVSFRTRQQISKWVDRLDPARERRLVPAGNEPMGFEPVPGRIHRALPLAPGVTLDEAPALLGRRSRGEILRRAGELQRGRFHLLGFEDLWFGDPVDWHLDPVSGRRWELLHWSRLDPLDVQGHGDVKIVWELNRHQWLLALGQAHRITRAPRHALKAAGLLRHWLSTNPRGLGINWTSSLEVALRLIAWCWALRLFDGAPSWDAALQREVRRGIGDHARHIRRYLSLYSSPNTHLTGEALGLFYAGALHPQLEGAQDWRTVGARLLVDQISRQVAPDGVYFEQSTCYQLYTAEIYLQFLMLSSAAGEAVPDLVSDRVQRLLDFLAAVSRPDGMVPAIGDADSGSLLPLETRNPGDVRGIMGLAAVLFGRNDYAWIAGGPPAELIWMLGRSGLEAFRALPSAPPPSAPSRLFPSGYAVLRSGWDHRSHSLLFDVGPLGCATTSGHGHADLLSIECSAFGEAFVVDPGTYRYTWDRPWRDAFRGTAAHSTVTVDGLDQADPEGPFSWRKPWPAARPRRWLTSDSVDFADAEHAAYTRLEDPVAHRRRVLFVKPRYWLVVDDLDGRSRHRIDLSLQFDAAVRLVALQDGWLKALRPSGRQLLLRVFGRQPLTCRQQRGEESRRRGWVSPAYGVRLPAPRAVWSLEAPLPLRLVTFIQPMEHPGAGPPAAWPRWSGGRDLGLRLPETGECLTITDDHLRVDRHRTSILIP